VFNSLRTLFVKARLIQDWLADAAQEISRAMPVEVASASFGYRPEFEIEGKTPTERYRTPDLPEDSTGDEFTSRYPQTSVSWDTPLGFRVVQPYLKSRSVLLKTVMQTLSLKTSNKLDPVDISKQVSAFPPNFIHSLDASHMFMTAVACFQAGLTFASVHDCFWTHASTVDQMNDRIREQFVELYSQPVLARLRDDFVKHYGMYKVPIKVPTDSSKPIGPEEAALTDDSDDISGKARKYVARWRHIHLPPVPEQGDFDISQVLKSQYFFS
jgi:DNA-directed RNA polymerase